MRKSPNQKHEHLRPNLLSGLDEVQKEFALVRDEHGWLVFTCTLPENLDWNKLVEYDREARIREIGGW